jgi:hypothetical protein
LPHIIQLQLLLLSITLFSKKKLNFIKAKIYVLHVIFQYDFFHLFFVVIYNPLKIIIKKNSIPNSLLRIWNYLKFIFKHSFNCFIFLLQYVYIMITKSKYNIVIILLIINSYLTCEIIKKLHWNILFYYWCLCFI